MIKKWVGRININMYVKKYIKKKRKGSRGHSCNFKVHWTFHNLDGSRKGGEKKAESKSFQYLLSQIFLSDSESLCKSFASIAQKGSFLHCFHLKEEKLENFSKRSFNGDKPFYFR